MVPKVRNRVSLGKVSEISTLSPGETRFLGSTRVLEQRKTLDFFVQSPIKGLERMIKAKAKSFDIAVQFLTQIRLAYKLATKKL